MPRIPEAAKPLAEVLDRLTAPAAPELRRDEGGGKVRCLACGHRCLVLPGQRGICQVRINDDGELRVPFGYVGALQCDPIEKKPFFHVVPGNDALTFGMLGCDLHCGYCFAEDVRVATTEGVRRIADLWNEAPPQPDGSEEMRRPGNFLAVITDEGRERPVRQVFRHRYRGELVRVRPAYLPAFEATPDHRVLATDRPGLGNPRLVPAGELTVAHSLAMPRRHHFSQPVAYDTTKLLRPHPGKFSTPYRIAASEPRQSVDLARLGLAAPAMAATIGTGAGAVRHLRTRGRRRGGRLRGDESTPARLGIQSRRARFGRERRPGIPATLPLSRAFAELLGYYCAEGSINSRRNRPNRRSLVLAFGLHETALAERVRLLLRRVFRVRASTLRRSTTLAVTVDRTSVALVFEALCGPLAAKKRVPAALGRAERDVAEAFLDAYVTGGGHRSADGEVSATTASEELAWGVAWLVLRLGHLPGLHLREECVNGVVLGPPVRRRPRTYNVVWYEGPQRSRRQRVDERFYYVPIREITRRTYRGYVYNLEVEDRHTYLANFFAVSNCQNWLTSQTLRDERSLIPPEVVSAPELARLAVRQGAAMLASSYNEPLITGEWGAAVMDEARRQGLLTAFVSNGNATPEALDFLRGHLDCYKVDLKAMRQEAYRTLGAKLENVLETIRGLKQRGFWVEIVTLLVPGLNDSEEEIREAARFLGSVDPLMPWHVTAFHPDYKMTDRDGTTARQLVRAAEIGLAEGLRYVYCGNIPGRVGPFEDTRCHGCGATLVRRVGYTILEDRLTPARGVCPACGTRVPGLWERSARA